MNPVLGDVCRSQCQMTLASVIYHVCQDLMVAPWCRRRPRFYLQKVFLFWTQQNENP